MTNDSASVAARLLALALTTALAACGGGADGNAASSDAGGTGARTASGTAPSDAVPPPSCADLASVPPDSMRTTDSGLRILQKKEGGGRAATPGDTVSVHYLGCLTDGSKFDASYDRNRPIRFTLGAGEVIEGWEQGIRGMRPGGVRLLRIPPELGYGERGTPGGPIPPGATLLFHVELVDVAPGGGSPGG